MTKKVKQPAPNYSNLKCGEVKKVSNPKNNIEIVITRLAGKTHYVTLDNGQSINSEIIADRVDSLAPLLAAFSTALIMARPSIWGKEEKPEAKDVAEEKK